MAKNKKKTKNKTTVLFDLEPDPTPSIYTYVINAISGIWNSYGCIPEVGKSVSLYLEKSTKSDDSLISLCGFDTNRRDIGSLNTSKEVSELVILLPMIDQYTEEPYVVPPEEPTYTPKDPCAPCEEDVDPCAKKGWRFKKNPKQTEKTKGMVYCQTEDAWMFVIDEKVINKVLGTKDYKTKPNGYIPYVLERKTDLNENNNIIKLMRSMLNYNLPPHLNWVHFHKEVPLYAMYVAEFKSTIDKQDLANIWQGTMPELAKNPEEEEIVIEHFLSEEEIFGGYNIATYEDVKLKVFKCKKRAKNDYYKEVKSTEIPYGNNWYQYNWPYDNFSLVELLKVDAGEVRDYKNNASVDDGVIKPASVTDTYSKDTFVRSYQVINNPTDAY